jgi:hypothetical protein
MAELIEEFIIIWNNNSNMLSIQANDFDKFIIIINKLRQKNKLEIQEKKIFIELIELMADTIYTINNCADKYESKYGTTYYQQTKKYEEPELNCCSNLINYLESELCWDLENEYDIAFTKSLLSNKII